MTNVRSDILAPVPQLTWQPSLLGATADEPAIDHTFARLHRVDLARGAWVDYCPGWVTGDSTLFARLLAEAPWRRRTVPMYGRMVEEPRLTVWFERGPSDPHAPTIFEAMADALTARYGREFDSAGAALYRDGRDSVAWHGDRIDVALDDPMVAIVSLGSPRTLKMRTKGGGVSKAFPLVPGDLLVMGGTAQRTWEHSVPKVAKAGPRLSVQLRHSR